MKANNKSKVFLGGTCNESTWRGLENWQIKLQKKAIELAEKQLLNALALHFGWSKGPVMSTRLGVGSIPA